ncbi:MAG: AAA family ATPase [Desulfurococcaceae archaeon]
MSTLDRRIPWIIKYRPRRIDDVVNQDNAKTQFIQWIKTWIEKRIPDKKAALLYGPAGCGKTSLVEAVANEYRIELVEMNASDFRRREDIERIASVAARISSLFTKMKIILLDEVDGINPRLDFGAVDAILDLIDKSRYPVVMTANDPWSQSLKPLRDVSLMIGFKRLSEKDVVFAL